MTDKDSQAGYQGISAEAEEALGKLQAGLMAALRLRGGDNAEIMTNALVDLGSDALEALSNGQAAQSLVEKIQSPDKMDPALRQQIIAKINDPEQRGPVLAQFMDEVKKDPSVLQRMNEDPGMLLALGTPVAPQPAPVAAAAPPLPSNPIPDIPAPVDMLQASLRDPDWNREKAEALVMQQQPVLPSDPVKADIYNPAAQAIAGQESRRRAEAEAAAAPPAPAKESPVATAETQELRNGVMSAVVELLKDDDAKRLLASAMRDHDVALFIGHQTGIDLSDYGSEEGGGLDPAKIKAKLEAMSDDELNAAKESIAAGKKYIEENRQKVQAFNGMPDAAQHSLATGANALSGFQDRLMDMGNNLMGGFMKNIGSIFSGNFASLFDGMDIGGMFKQFMGMITGMIGKFSGSEGLKGLSNMGGQMMSGLTETLGAATGQRPGEQIAYDVDGRRVDPKAPVLAAAQQPPKPGQQQPGQPQPGTAAS